MALTPTSTYAPGLQREWERLRSPGTWWTGSERLAIAAVARAAKAGTAMPVTDLPRAASEAAQRLSADPHVDKAWVDHIEAGGITLPAYVEILGIVARLTAVDTFLFGIGADEHPLPDAAAGEPSRELVPDAVVNGGFVPTVGRASAPNALSAVEAETDALLDLHGVLYLS
ncbi:MAG: hypothetical protein ACC660_07825, partial [Acidimicrobiales bacterium]